MQFRFIDPANDFSNGITVLRTYHENFLSRGKSLLLLANHIYTHGMNETCAHQCIEFHNFYTRANKLHHQDEEHALFPAIVNHSFLIDGMIERLTLDHEEIEESWDELSELLASPEKITGFGKLKRLTEEFEKIQRQHLVRENEDFLDLAEAELDINQLQEIGQTMAWMRGVNLDNSKYAI